MNTNEYSVKITRSIGEGGREMQVFGPFSEYDTAEEFGNDRIKGTDDKFDVYMLVPVKVASPKFKASLAG